MISNENKAFQKKGIKHDTHSNDYFKNLLNSKNSSLPKEEVSKIISTNIQENSSNNHKLAQLISDMNNQEMLTLGSVNNCNDSNQQFNHNINMNKDQSNNTDKCMERIANLIDISYNEEEGIFFL